MIPGVLDEASLDTAAYLDISFLPVGRRRRQAFKNRDRRRGRRYFWARVGYDRVSTRYRWRVEATREFVVLDHGVAR